MSISTMYRPADHELDNISSNWWVVSVKTAHKKENIIFDWIDFTALSDLVYLNILIPLKKQKQTKKKNALALLIHTFTSIESLAALRPLFNVRTKKNNNCISTVVFWSNALNMHIFLFSGSRSVRIDILFLNLRHL